MDHLKGMFTSDKHDWATPKELYDDLDKEFSFTIDVCASEWNAKHIRYWTITDDALSKSWVGERCFMNPPYGRDIKKWVRKAREESDKGALVVALIPARTDTSYWWEHIQENPNATVRFIKGRVKFIQPNSKRNSAPFPSAIIIFDRKR